MHRCFTAVRPSKHRSSPIAILTFSDPAGRTTKVVYPDGSFAETLYGTDGSPVSREDLTIPDGLSIPAGGSETVSIAARQSGDPLEATYRIYNAAAAGDSIRQVQGKQPIGGAPSKAKYLDSFLLGFDISANQEFIAPDSILGDTAISGIMGGLGDVVSDAIGGGTIDWKAAIRDTITTAAIGLVVNPRTVGLLHPNAELVGDVAKYFSTKSGTAAVAEVSLLVQAWLP